jgi:hypothetical protein
VSDLREAAEEALSVLEGIGLKTQRMTDAVAGLRQALAQPEEEFVDGAMVGEVGVWGEKAKPALHCPLKKPDCKENCGSYGCGN